MELNSIISSVNGILNNNSSNKSKTSDLSSSLKSLNSSDKSNSPASKISIVKKGETGYMSAMDLDDDGEITLEEFNQYCSENGVSDEDKLKLLKSIQTAKNNEKMLEKTKEKAEEENKVIYAKKGDDKYNEEMDSNKNDVVTYEEYIAYCEEQSKSSDKKDDKVKEEYSASDEKQEEQVSVEAEA